MRPGVCGETLRPMESYEDQLKALAGREAFALAQGREDLLDIIDAERRKLEATHAEQDAMQRGGNWIEEA